MVRLILSIILLSWSSLVTGITADESNDCQQASSYVSASFSYLKRIENNIEKAAAEELLEKSYSELEKLATLVSKCGGIQVLELLDRGIDFHAFEDRTEKSIELYKKSIANALAEYPGGDFQKYIDNVYILLWKLRFFKRKNEWYRQFHVSERALQQWPLISPTVDFKGGAYVIRPGLKNNESVSLSVEEVSTEGINVVVLADLHCAFSRSMFNDLVEREFTFVEQDKFTFIFPQMTNSPPLEVAELQRKLPTYKLAIVGHEGVWSNEINFYQFPVFYFLKGNEVLDVLPGWPSREQAELVNEVLSQLIATNG